MTFQIKDLISKKEFGDVVYKYGKRKTPVAKTGKSNTKSVKKA